MTTEIRQALQAVPFEPFAIVMSSGTRYPVPTADHAGLHPQGSRLVVWLDNGSGATISALHVAAIEVGRASGGNGSAVGPDESGGA